MRSVEQRLPAYPLLGGCHPRTQHMRSTPAPTGEAWRSCMPEKFGWCGTRGALGGETPPIDPIPTPGNGGLGDVETGLRVTGVTLYVGRR